MQIIVFASAVLAAAIIAVSPAAVLAGESTSLQPSSKWHIDYATGYCRLAREFGGSQGRKTAFFIEQYEPDSRFTVVTAGPDFDATKVRDFSVRFGPAGAEAVHDQFRLVSLGDFGPGLSVAGMGLLADASPQRLPDLPAGSTRYDPPPAPSTLNPADAAQISQFDLLTGGLLVARLELGPMDGPVRAMNACTEELLTHWGIDVAEHRTRLRGPEPQTDPGTWISANDYPSKLQRDGMEGVVNFRLNVDESGKVTGCEIQQSTRPEGFESVVCRKMMRKASFRPALNAARKPMRSYWRSGVSFSLPE